MELMGLLEKFLHNETITLPTLVKAALAHHQFETIHPFLDGNGRIGRLFITLILCVNGISQKPMLYLSLDFKTHRQAYYDHLQLVRETGDWEEWIQFFLKGVIKTSNQAIETTQKILTLFTEDRKKIETTEKSSLFMSRIHDYLQKHPIAEAKHVVKNCKMTLPTANKSLNQLLNIGVLKEITGKSRNRIYVYQKYLNILNEGTDYESIES